MKQQTRLFNFSNYCLGVWLLCLLVILWGAWVRISHSGDACGQSWPSCQGQYLIDALSDTSVWIEWIHRATSGFFGLTVIGLVLWAFLRFPSRHLIRKTSLLSVALTIVEALIGAGLVLFGLTGSHLSFTRLLVIGFHLMNSLLLVTSLFVTWRLSLGKTFTLSSILQNKIASALVFFFLIIAFLGSVASLSTTLFPSSSLFSGITQDFSPGVHWLIRLRILHPILALGFGGGILLYYFHFLPIEKKSDLFLKTFIICLCLALLSGLGNLLFLSPVFLKLTHLLSVYLLTMSFILTLETPTNNQI